MRENDERVGPLVAQLDHADTRATTVAERTLLEALQGGCQVPIAGHARLEGDELVLEGLVARVDGSETLRASARGARADGEALGRAVAAELLDAGAEALISDLREAGG